MEDPSNSSQSFPSSPESVSFVMSPSSHTPITDSQLWQNPICNSSDAELQTTVGSGKRYRCHVCRKDFKTNGALKTHLFIHKQDRVYSCGVCQRAFSHNHQLTSHMKTHHKRKTYHCTYSGCHKSYDDKNSLNHHCASQHGEHLMTLSSTCHVSNYDLPASFCKQNVNHVLKSSIYSGKPFGSHDMGKHGLGCYKEDSSSSAAKYSTQEKRWTLGESCKANERTKMSTSTHWTLVSDFIAEDPVVLQNPFNGNSLETSLDFSESYPEEWKQVFSFQPKKEATTSSMGCPTRPHASVCIKNNRLILINDSAKETKPSNMLKRRHSISSFNSAAFCPKPKSGFDCNLPHTTVPSFNSPLPSSRNRKSSSKTTGSPMHVPQPTCHARLKSRPSFRVSPSQVVLASFNTFSSNPFLPKKPIMKLARDEPNYRWRTSSACKAQTKPSCSQDAFAFDGIKEKLDSHSASTTLDEGQKGASRHKQRSKGIKLSPLIIPVSVPVSAPNALAPQVFTQQDKSAQACKRAPKSHHLDPLNCLVIPNPTPPHPSNPQCTSDQETHSLQRHCSTGGFPSQLRSPAYLVEHPLSPKPYTPPAMLSPLCPGTGLYFKYLPQYQPCPSLPNTPGVSFQADNTIVNKQPKINIGSSFQAEIPPVRDTFYLLYEEHPAQLTWTPWKDLSTNTETQQRVKELIDLCCSSVIPGGGTNIELALHCLHEVQGNITAALDLLLMRGDFRTSSHALNNYHYTGSDCWTAHEMKLFKKALDDYEKDFRQIHNVVQTKSVAQCVEYYYNMKQLKKFKQRGRAVNKKNGGRKNTVTIVLHYMKLGRFDLKKISQLKLLWKQRHLHLEKTFKCSQQQQPEQTDMNTKQETTSC